MLLPTRDRAAFVSAALGSLAASSLTDWELVVIDGSTDDTSSILQPWLEDPRIRLLGGARHGLGAALNAGLDAARAPLVAYLPSDDTYLPDHLAALADLLDQRPDAVAAVASLLGDPPSEAQPWPQLVQVVHRATHLRWLTDADLVTDDLERLLWGELRALGPFVDADVASCTWTEHPDQRSRHIRESTGGGLNPFRSRYQVRHPLRFQSSEGELVDEVALYVRFRRERTKEADGSGLRILLVGELAYNPERVLAFEERGHELLGLWTSDPSFFNTVGPLPFGSCTDLPRAGWREEVTRLRPDVIYALLNWRAIPIAHEVLSADLGIPFVWHFKEGPWFSMAAGTWPQLVDLCTRADATVFSSAEQLDWFHLALPGRLDPGRCLVVDGDLPKRDWLIGERTERLSGADGEPHTAVLGRPMGIDPAFVGRLARAGIHTHFRGLVRSEAMARSWAPWIAEARRLAPDHFHLEPAVDQRHWVTTLSRYDAAWLHVFTSQNRGDLRRATWDDLNVPARLGTMGVAGLPPIQRANLGSRVATRSLTERLGVGLTFEDDDFGDLRRTLDVEVETGAARDAVWDVREALTFDAHVGALVQRFGMLCGPEQRSTRA